MSRSVQQVVTSTQQNLSDVRKFSPSQTEPATDTLPVARSDQRHRRKSMAARSGQRGSVEKKGKWYYVRFWIEVAGQYERKHKAVRLCPVEGEGSLSKVERARGALQIVAEYGANSEKHFQKYEAETCATAFREQ